MNQEDKNESKKEDGPWCGAKVKCDLCSHEWIAVFHADSEKLECPNCGNMAYYEVSKIED